MYTYKVRNVLKVYDGDTITVEIDCGFDTFRIESLRLANINTPELRGDEREEGLKSRDWLRLQIERAKILEQDITIKTYKDKTGKYGRYIADLYIEERNINEELVQEGLAERRKY